MADLPWEHAAEARAALSAIVTDPDHGVDALSSPRTMSNLLKDLLPDAPREKNLFVAAAEAGLADSLREHVSQGMDMGTAIRLTASSFSASTALSPGACSWVTTEIAMALGISEGQDHGPHQAAASPGSYPVGQVRTGVDLGKASFGTGQPSPGAGYAGVPGQLAGQPLPGQPLPGQPLPGQPLPGQAPGYRPFPAGPRSPKTNSLAIASLVLGVVQFPLWIALLLPGLIAAVLAIVFGFVARQQIGRSGETSRGLALAGILLAGAGIVVVTILLIAGVASSSQ